jgi:hypothetical protein
MDRVAKEHLNLPEITAREVAKYAGHTHNAAVYSILDDKQQRYGVVIVPEDEEERPAYMAVFARVVGEYVVIDEDGTLDKPLVNALMHNAGVPREQIVLAYEGERIPNTSP